MNTEKRLFTNSELEEIRKMRLIAAAPELLAALNGLSTWLEADSKGYCAKELRAVSLERHLEQARAAIAKAKGVSHE